MLISEIAATIRTLRTKQGLAYEDLADVCVQRSISALEQGQVSISVSKLAELSVALDFDLVALVAISVSLQRAESPHAVLKHAALALAEFTSTGGEKLLAEQFKDGHLVKRTRGKPANQENASNVRRLKAEGFSQAEVAQSLSLAKSTVNRYWQDER